MSYFSFISNHQLREFAYLKTIVTGDALPILNSNWLKCCITNCADADWCHWWLSGDLHKYFLMRDLSGRTSKFIMWCEFSWINIFPQIIRSFFLLTDFNRLDELLISCSVFQKCDAKADFSIWFNLRFLKCSFVF